jgi:hypothetical protein
MLLRLTSFVGSHFVRPQLRQADEFYIISGDSLRLTSFVSVKGHGMDNGRVSGIDKTLFVRLVEANGMRPGSLTSRTKGPCTQLGSLTSRTEGPCRLRRAIQIIGMRRAWLLELSDSIREYIRAAERLEFALLVPDRVHDRLDSVDLINMDEPMLT